jgi:putative ABC transport system permease protein
MKNSPPARFLRFFQWYCHPKLRDHIEGDLMEVYNECIKAFGKGKADRKFIIDVLLLFRPGIIRPVEGYKNLNTYGMYKSYFKIGWRNLLRNKGYSFINIGGLAIGMAVAMLIGLWINDELEFNKYHKNYNSIARVVKSVTMNGSILTNMGLPYPLGDELKTKYGNSLKHVLKARPVGDHILSAEKKSITLSGEFIEAAAPEMFSLNMLQGSWSGLKDPHSILLSQSAAKVLFGDDDPMDKLLKIDNGMDVKVTGVYEDLPYNTHFYNVKFFAPWDLFVSSNEWMKYQNFTNNFVDIYVAIEDHTSFEAASNEIRDAILNNVRDDKGYASFNPQIFLHPMKDWHLRSGWKNGVNTGGLIQTVWLFGIVGAFVLLLACINFMNLSTARSEKRAKEVGIRKAIGSVRRQLMGQFFSESFLVVVLAFLFAFTLVSSSLGWFNNLAGKQMEMPLTNVYFWLISIVFIVFTGVLAGSYPAFYLSSFNPVRVLKGSLRVGRFASIPRKVLVVVQFTVSVTLIIGTIIVYRQIQFAKDRPVGYTRNGLLMVQMTSPDFHGKYDVLRTELKNTGVVTEMAESSSPLTDIWNSNGGFDWEGKDPAFIAEFATMTVTPEFGKTVGWQFTNGRDFSRNIAGDSAGFVINETMAKLLGFENPVGETVRWTAGWRSKFTSFTIIGVIKDMVMKSPYAPAAPAVFFLSEAGTNWINIRIDPQASASDALPKIESVFKKVIPTVPFDYKFTDQEYALKFAAEERIGKLASVFAVLAILISCLGLFGLASFVAEQRTKEIGIRKVVGASVFNLWKMLSKDFVVLVVISCLTAIPIAYYFLAEWLKKYEYRTEISWWIFAVTSMAALLITLLTVSYQAVKAALMKPVNSLRSE